MLLGVVTLASFLSSGTQHATLNGPALFFAFVLWLSLGFWTYKDARRRIEDPLLDRALRRSLALVIPFLGPFIYMLFRPPEYLEDVRERELEIKAMEERSRRPTSAARSATPRSTRAISSAPSARRSSSRRA